LNRRIAVVVILALVAAALLGGFAAYKHRLGGEGASAREIVVCSAGSLGLPLKSLAQSYERETGVKVLLKLSGSVDIVRQVSQLGLRCDVVAVADYRLIPLFLYPNLTSWYIVFAGNEMVIAWRGHGGSLAEALKAIESGRASYGTSDPNRDPCGYRAVGALALYSLYYNDTRLLESLIASIPGARYEVRGGILHIYIPASFTPRGGLVVRPKSVELLSLLESGEIDYAILYKSEAVEHNLTYAPLPPRANLGDPGLADAYGRVVVHILAGTPQEKAIAMAPIAYGLTVPSNARDPGDAVEFVRYVLTHGREVFESHGFIFYTHPRGYGRLPGQLGGLAVEEGSP